MRKRQHTHIQQKKYRTIPQQSGASLTQGPWTDDENLLAIVLLKVSNHLGIMDDAIHHLYEKYHTYNVSVSNQLQIRTKSLASVNAKIKSIRQHEKFG